MVIVMAREPNDIGSQVFQLVAVELEAAIGEPGDHVGQTAQAADDPFAD